MVKENDPDVTFYDYPSWFNMFAYNDQKETLVFMGFYCTDKDYNIAGKVKNWGAFLDEFYGEFFDFDA